MFLKQQMYLQLLEDFFFHLCLITSNVLGNLTVSEIFLRIEVRRKIKHFDSYINTVSYRKQ